MKNVIKKIAAVAMAFTLLGAGTAITNTVAPQATLTASATASCGRWDPHPHGQYQGWITKRIGTDRKGKGVYITYWGCLACECSL